MWRTIRVRLTLWYVALLALILIVFSTAIYLTFTYALDQQVDNALQLNSEQLAGAVNIEQGQINFQSGEGETSDALGVRERGYLVRLLDARGGIVDTTASFAALPVPLSALDMARRGEPSFANLTASGHFFRLYTTPIVENGTFYGALQLAQSLDSVMSARRQLLLLLAAIVPLTLLAASAGGFWFARRALAPMDHITRAAQRISAKDLSERLNLNLPDDEVGRLARTFDGMLARLDAAFRREREFTANASHELRTPLTVMRGEIDVALNRPRATEEYRQVLRELGEEVERLTKLTEDLLMLARADAGKLPLQFQAVNAARLIQAVVDEMRPLSEEKDIVLTGRADEALTVWADEDRLLHVLLNLVENALKFSPPGGTVTLTATRDGAHANLAVADTGIGIAPDHLPHIFERFYRADQSRSSRVAGMGLGLAIAYSLVTAQGGTIEAHSAVGHGTTFVLKMPSDGSS